MSRWVVDLNRCAQEDCVYDVSHRLHAGSSKGLLDELLHSSSPNQLLLEQILFLAETQREASAQQTYKFTEP